MIENRVSNSNNDGVDRRGFLHCMAWAGTGLAWSVSGGVLTSRVLGQEPVKGKEDFVFAQISDSHIGFNKPPYGDVVGTLKVAVDRVNAMKQAPSLVLHTGDLTHLAKPDEFDTVSQVLKGLTADKVAFVPGEHDVFTDDGKAYLERYGKGTKGTGWQSFDFKGVHFVGLVNVTNLKAAGLGVLGTDQLDWLKKDLAGLVDSTPVVVFAHVPLWTVYEKWGWGTEDGTRVLEMVKRFGSVAVLNGHVHQVLQKVEGTVTFHTARSTAFPQPEPGKAESPGPVKNLAADKVRAALGVRQVNFVATNGSLAVADSTLE
jgi:3',5'-cyclic AMP phosphodiesterase CpdA